MTATSEASVRPQHSPDSYAEHPQHTSSSPPKPVPRPRQSVVDTDSSQLHVRTSSARVESAKVTEKVKKPRPSRPPPPSIKKAPEKPPTPVIPSPSRGKSGMLFSAYLTLGGPWVWFSYSYTLVKAYLHLLLWYIGLTLGN